MIILDSNFLAVWTVEPLDSFLIDIKLQETGENWCHLHLKQFFSVANDANL